MSYADEQLAWIKTKLETDKNKAVSDSSSVIAEINAEITAGVVRQLSKQMHKGLVKYGKTVDPMDGNDWLQHAIEETTDLLIYLHCEKIRRNSGAGE